MKKLEATDYRKDIPKVDSYGRRKCFWCEKRRKVNAYWRDTNKVLCKGCSVKPDVSFNLSVRTKVKEV